MSAAFKYSWRVGSVPARQQMIIGHTNRLRPSLVGGVVPSPETATVKATGAKQSPPDFMPYFPYGPTREWRSFVGKGTRLLKWSFWHGYTPRKKYHTHVGHLFAGSGMAQMRRGAVGTVRFYSSDLPNHTKVALPALSPTMEHGTIVSWQKKEGDQLSEGDLLCEIETDKATMGFETPEEGYLAKIVVPEGSRDIPIGRLLCIIVENKDDVDAFKEFTSDSADAGGAAAAPAKQKKPAEAPAAPQATPQPRESLPSAQSSEFGDEAASTGRVKASPYAKKLAAEQGVDLSCVAGSGPGGRILAADLSHAGRTAPSSSEADYEDIPLSNMRKTIAKRLTESKTQIPHYYLTTELLIDHLLQVRSTLNQLLEKDAQKGGAKPHKLSLNDFIIKATALACLRVPEANSSFMGAFIRHHLNVDVSVAVSTDMGLITPIVFGAHHKGVLTISQEVGTLAAKAREGKLQPHEFQGGTFTVSNLGMFGSVDHFTAIINPPQACILAIGGAKRKLVPGEDGEHKTVTAMNVTLSCDHRVVDGAVGAVWLRHFKQFIEHPHTMLL